MTTPLAFPLAVSWWIPTNYSTHGAIIDTLFNWIFAITMIIMIAVFVVMIAFLIIYRHRPGKAKGKYIHGNSKLELCWTVLPAIILLGLALGSKQAWDRYRFSPDLDDPNAAQILIIARQFNWNPIYSGQDNKLGQYLVYPRPTDAAWPAGLDGKPVAYESDGVSYPSPASVPAEKWDQVIRNYCAPGDISPTDHNQFGKVFANPDSGDDIVGKTGQLELPLNRPSVLEITSMDVIHDFYLPNFRVNVYAVPGMRVRIALTPTATNESFEKQTVRNYDLAELAKSTDLKDMGDLIVEIDDSAPGDSHNRKKTDDGWVYFSRQQKVDEATGKPKFKKNGQPDMRDTPIQADGKGLPNDEKNFQQRIADLQAIGLTQIRCHTAKVWEIVCAQLCGAQHSNMEGRIRVLEADEWKKRYQTKQEE